MLQRLRNALTRPSWSGLRSALPWLVLLVSVSSTITAWQFLVSDARERGMHAFDVRAQRLAKTLRQRLLDVEQDMRGNAALLAQPSPGITRAWQNAVEALRMPQTYPGLEAMGYAPLQYGPTQVQTRAATVLLVPNVGRHRAAFGHDLFQAPALRAKLQDAIAPDQVSYAVHPVPWKIADPQAGNPLWAFLPVYAIRGETAPATEKTALIGYQWTLIQLGPFIDSLLDESYSFIEMRVYAGSSPNPGGLLYEWRGSLAKKANIRPVASTQQSLQIALPGQPLYLYFGVHPEFDSEFNSSKSTLTLVGGGIISALVFLIAWFSASVQQRARELARDMTSAHAAVQARLTGIIHTAMDAIITVDEQQIITLFNPAAESIFGYKADAIIGTSLDRLIPVEARARHHEHVSHFGQTGSTSRTMGGDFVISGVRANGEVFPIDASISRLREGNRTHYTVILRDITLRKRAEEALHQSQTELRDTNERLRQLSAHAETTRENERIRIAREIHDDLAATLTGIKMDLSAARDGIKRDPEHVESRLRACLGLIDGAVLTTRRIINDLRPSILDNLGVWAAIEWLARETSRRAGIRCVAYVDPELEDLTVSPALATALFRVVQEALSNVWRHAQATTASVQCERRGRNLSIEVIDDGQGMDQSKLKKPGHWGILGMEERIRSLGGEISLTSTQGKGTLIRVTVPLS